MRIKGPIGLEHTQIEQDTSQYFLDFNVALIRDWLNELPHGNFGVIAKTLYDFILEFNRTEVETKARFEAAELLLPHIHTLLLNMDEHFLQDLNLPSDKKRKIGLLMTAISLALCDSYKRIIEEAGQRLRHHKTIMIESLHRLSALYLDVLYRNYQRYRSPPARLWFEFHTLYQYALKMKLSTKEAQLYEALFSRHLTIEHVYKHALLLTCANPFSLRQAELFKLNFALEAWAPLLKFVPFSSANHDIYLVDPSQDLPPYSAHLDNQKGSNCFHLNMEMILHRFEKLTQYPGTNNQAQALSECERNLPIHLVRILRSTWSQVGERGADRVEQMGRLQVTLGIQSIFNVLNVNGDACVTPIDDSSSDTEEIVFDSLPLSEPSPSVHPETSFEFIETTLINISPTGLCLEFDEPYPFEMKTGQLIGIQLNREHPHDLSIGALRWIKKTSQHKARCGIKIMSPYAKPLLATIGENNHHTFKTLWIPQETNVHPFFTLVAPLLPFKSSSTIYVSYQEKQYPLFLENIVDSASNFNQFKLRAKDANALPFLHTNQTQSMDDLWGTLNF